MRLREASKIKDPPPIYDPNGNQFTMSIYVYGRIEEGTYEDGSLHKFDYVNGDLLNIETLEKYGQNCLYGMGDVNKLYSCVEKGKFEEITNDKDFKTLIQSTLLGNRELVLYFELIEGDELDEEVEVDEHEGEDDAETRARKSKKKLIDDEYISDSEDSDYKDESEKSEEQEDGGLGEEEDGDSGIDMEGSGEEDVNISEDDFNSDKGSDCENEGDSCPVFNPKHMYTPQLKLKMLFSNKWEFIKAVHSDSVAKKRNIRLVKNDKKRVYARCKSEGCEWRVHANVIPNEPTFQIRTYQKPHTCPESYHINNMSSSWLSGRYGYQFKTNPKRKVSDFKTDLMYELNVNITNHQAYKAKKMALEDLTGNGEFQYKLVWDFASEVKRTNPHSTVLVDVVRHSSGPVVFDKMYFCLHALKVGFLLGCRKLVGVDGCHLKGPYGGILLSAVGVDPNNNTYPIAYAVVGKETGDTWGWFLSVLKKDLEIEEDKVLTFISDKQKGLVQAFEEVFPNAAHRFCVRHLHGNLRNAGFGGQAFKDAVFKAAKATTENEWKRRMNEIKELSPMLHDWLSVKPPRHWCKSHFNFNAKCDMILNNICESFNAAILPARELPIVSMLEWIMDYLRERLKKHRERAKRGKRWKGKLCPRIQHILRENMKNMGGCQPMKADDWHYQIRMIDGTQYAVDLRANNCGCKKWDLTGIPCVHAMRAIYCQGLNPEDFTNECYRVDTYKLVYDHSIMPINGRDEWEPTGIVPPLPPKIGRQAGRPPKARRREPDEIVQKIRKRTRGRPTNNPHVLKRRQFGPMKCSKCHKPGHNKRGCKTPNAEVPENANANINEESGQNLEENSNQQGSYQGLMDDDTDFLDNHLQFQEYLDSLHENEVLQNDDQIAGVEEAEEEGEANLGKLHSQAFNDLAGEDVVKTCMNIHTMNAVLKKKSKMQTQESNHAVCSASVPSRNPPSMWEQMHGTQQSEETRSLVEKDGMRFVSIKNLGKFLSKKKK